MTRLWLWWHRWQHGQVRDVLHTLTPGGWCPPSGLGVTHWHVWACRCGRERRR